MISTFYMPTSIVAGAGSLATIGRLARDLGMSRALVVSDPVISAQPFHAEALAALDEAGIGTARFDECGIDARCSTSMPRASASAATVSTAWSASAAAR